MALELSIESLPDNPRDEESLLTTPTSTRARLLADIRELAPDITARAAEIEAGRRVPVDLVTRLKSIGVFRMFVPQSHGGLEVDLPSALEIIAALSRIDGSVGWTVAIGNGSGIFASLRRLAILALFRINLLSRHRSRRGGPLCDACGANAVGPQLAIESACGARAARRDAKQRQSPHSMRF
jgi:hypothetical protein